MSSQIISQITYNFSGKTVLVTGASNGIGRDIALSFARNGAIVCATDRNMDGLTKLTNEIVGLGGACETFQADLAEATECIAMAEHFLQIAGHIDILVNNAGLSFPETIIDLDIAHWDKTLQVNLRAPAIITKIIGADMVVRNEGIIVNVTSNAGVGGIREHAAYCASKFGFHGLSKVMAIEFGPHNIRVNCVAPTVVLTPMGVQVWSDPEKSEPIRKKIPLGRFALPSEVTNVVLFLASDAASMIHGEVLLVDGGANANLY